MFNNTDRFVTSTADNGLIAVDIVEQSLLSFKSNVATQDSMYI